MAVWPSFVLQTWGKYTYLGGDAYLREKESWA